MDDTPARGRRGTPQITVSATVQVPHQAKMSAADAGDGAGGSVPVPTSRTTAHFETGPRLAAGRIVAAPAGWDGSLTGFLGRLCSAHNFGLESLAIWHDEVARISAPAAMTREQWVEAEDYVAYLARQLAANNPRTGNLAWAMFHYVVHMRCLKTVDFLCDVDPALGNLQVVLHVVLRGVCAVLTADEQSRVLADRPVASGTVDLLVDKARALADGEVRAHAFRQAQADPTPLHRQVLHYTVLAISRLDLRRSPQLHAFYRAQLAMVADLFAPQSARPATQPYPSVLARELLETVGPSGVFDIARPQAEE
ncbi:hypothetical protein H4R21_006232, partial [Coemansia helicoidea]